MSQPGSPAKPKRGIPRWVPLVTGFLAGCSTLVWLICSLQLVVTGVVIYGEPKAIYTGEYQLHFCGVVLDETKGIDIDEVNDSSSRILIVYWCLLILIPTATGLLVGGLVKFLSKTRRATGES